MLSWFRDNAKIFLVVIIVIFVVMIFVDWGSGRSRAARTERMVMGSVNGISILPGSYDAARNEVYTSLKTGMERSGNPDPEGELALLYSKINDAAFDLVVERQLQSEFMGRLGWKQIHTGLADPLIRAQIRLAGIPDPDTYLQQFRNDPNYSAAAYQLLLQAQRSRFDSALTLFRMSSRAEALFMARDMYTQIQARYIPFRSTPPIPDEDYLIRFYDNNTNLFDLPARADIRFVSALVAPSEEDISHALNLVDSLAMAGGGTPDTLSLTRSQMLEHLGWDLDLVPGHLSQPFIGRSLSHPHIPFHVCHSVELLHLSPGPDPEGRDDSLVIVHWELPAFPSRATMRNTLWAMQDHRIELLETPNPFVTDQLEIVDWGERRISEETPPGPGLSQAMIAFALDTVWTDSIGPVFYNPGFEGGYPALTIVRRISRHPGGQLTLDEAISSGILLTEAYTRLQEQEALALASAALVKCRATGDNLALMAEADTLEIYTTQSFSPMSVRINAESMEASHHGLLGASDFADASILAPELTPIGPFVNGGVAYLAEITRRTVPDFDQERALLTSVYISLEHGRSRSFSSVFLGNLRDRADVVDGREDFYTMMDSLRAAGSDHF